MAQKSLSTAQAAALLGVSAQTIQKWVDDGHLLAWRTVGGHRRVDVDAVQVMLVKRQNLPSRPTPSGTEKRNPPATAQVSAGEAKRARVPTIYIVAGAIEAASSMKPEVHALLPAAHVQAFGHVVPALLAMGRQAPDLLIAESALADVDLVSVLRLLRQEPATACMQVVLVSPSGPTQVKLQAQLPPGLPILLAPLKAQALRPYLLALT